MDVTLTPSPSPSGRGEYKALLDAFIFKYGYKVAMSSAGSILMKRDEAGEWVVVYVHDGERDVYELVLNRIEQMIYDDGKAQRSFEIENGIDYD